MPHLKFDISTPHPLYFRTVSAKDVPPSITLPTSDYYTIVKMSNHAIVGVFRQHVFARRTSQRYAHPIPEEHDSYYVKRMPDSVMVRIFHDGNEIYRCIFVPPADY